MKRTLLPLFLLLLLLAPAWAMTLKEIDDLIMSYQLDQAQAELQTMLDKEPDNPELLKRMGFVYVLKLNDEQDPDKNAALCQKARDYLGRAIKNGCNDPLAEGILKELPTEGGVKPTVFSKIPEADLAMKNAEKAFNQSKFPEAVEFYTEAERLDPKLYFAPLYMGDAWLRQGDFKKARESYDRAIAVEPNLETAYRYKGNALMAQGDIEAALQSYAAAVVAEPGSEMAWKRGMGRWAQATESSIEIPHFQPPVKLSEDGTEITMMVDKDDKNAAPWLAYGAARSMWRTKHPAKTYRHTLAEEYEALDTTVKIAKELEENGSITPDKNLKFLMLVQQDGLLEPFIFFCMPDEEILDDYIPYRETHRDKLIQFVSEYLVKRKLSGSDDSQKGPAAPSSKG